MSQNEALERVIKSYDKLSAFLNELVAQTSSIISNISEIDNIKTDALSSVQHISAVTEETAASSQEIKASVGEAQSTVKNLSENVEELEASVSELEHAIAIFKI